MVFLAPNANPIEWQETRYQRRSGWKLPGWWRIAAPLLLLLAFSAVLLSLRDISAPTRELAILIVWIVHAVVGARAIVAGANAISREHTGLTWDTLILTGISARRILLGKWLGTLHVMAPWLLVLGGVRLLMLPVFMLAFVNRFAWRAGARGGYPSSYAMTVPSELDWVPWAAALAVIMTVVLSVLEVLCCTALGLAASAITRRSNLASIGALCVRFTPVVLFTAFTRYEVGSAPSWRILRFPALSLADGGSAPLYQLALPLTSWTNTAHASALPGLFMAAALLIGLLALALVTAWWAIRAAGALPHLEESLVA